VRVLLASTAGAGHYDPLVPFAETALRRGDEVLFVVSPGLAETVRAAGFDHRIGADPPVAELDAIWARWAAAPPDEAAVLANREIFGRLCTAAMWPSVDAACRRWRPDLVLHDPCEFASVIAADRYGIRSAQDVVPSPSRSLPDWWPGDDRPLLYVTFGSVAGGVPVGALAGRRSAAGGGAACSPTSRAMRAAWRRPAPGWWSSQPPGRRPPTASAASTLRRSGPR